MQLNNNMRESLLSELAKAKEDRALQVICARKEAEKGQMTEWFEIGIFLAQERIKLIEKSLIENKIDY
jgi:hypothetical protein